ncbi:MAG: class I SAM-dependent methyltransferase [Bdellovibrionales bacterium]
MSLLQKILITKIVESGAIPLSEFMNLALLHPAHGYYMTRDPLGQRGDFITAPEISQIFGEAIGLWAANEWLRLGRPGAFTLLELGPGRGTLMADALRAITQVTPDFLRGMNLQLMEASPVLRSTQQGTLESYRPTYIDNLAHLPPQPLIVIANEFFDALPVDQYRFNGIWQRRVVKQDGDKLAWSEEAVLNAPGPIQALRPTAWTEYSEASVDIMQALAAHISRHAGALVAIDYGYKGPAAGDTVQALRQHGYTNPLEDVGDADITVHVDFGTLASAAAPLQTTLTTQGDFLRALGGDERLAALCANKDDATQAMLRSGYARLTASDQMGELFKVLLVTR